MRRKRDEGIGLRVRDRKSLGITVQSSQSLCGQEIVIKKSWKMTEKMFALFL